MKVIEKKKLWTCPKCGRQFGRKGQVHSCRSFPLELHFKRKPIGKSLYDAFKKKLESNLGSVKTESLECCIHFVSSFTFVAIKILKDRIRIDFALNRPLDSPRIRQKVQMSTNRYLHIIDINNEAAIDEELIEWIREANDKGVRKELLLKK